MKVAADLCIVPMAVGPSVSDYVVEIQKVLSGFDLQVELHANGTNIEGELVEIARATEACFERLFAMGVPRVHTSLIFGARVDKQQRMADKLAVVRRKQGGDA